MWNSRTQNQLRRTKDLSFVLLLGNNVQQYNNPIGFILNSLEFWRNIILYTVSHMVHLQIHNLFTT